MSCAPARQEPRAARVLGAVPGWLLQVVDQAVFSGSTFVALAWLARVQGPEAFGRFAYLFSAVAAVQCFQNAVVLVPMATLSPEPRRALAVAARALEAAGIAVVAGVALHVTRGAAPAPRAALAAAAAAYCAAYLRMKVRRQRAIVAGTRWTLVAYDVASSLLLVGLAVAASPLGTAGPLAAFAVAYLVPLAMLAGDRAPDAAADAGFARWWETARWNALETAAFMLVSYLALWLLAGAEHAGVMAACTNLVTPFIVVQGAVLHWQLAPWSRLGASAGLPALDRSFRRFFARAAGFAVASAAALAALGPTVVELLYGPRYAALGGAYIRLSAASLLFTLLYSALGMVLRATGDARGLFFVRLAQGAATVALAPPLVRRAGLDGAALTAAASSLLSLGGHALLYWRRMRARR